MKELKEPILVVEATTAKGEEGGTTKLKSPALWLSSHVARLILDNTGCYRKKYQDPWTTVHETWLIERVCVLLPLQLSPYALTALNVFISFSCMCYLMVYIGFFASEQDLHLTSQTGPRVVTPRYFYGLFAIAQYLGWCLDVLDGAQARRNGAQDAVRHFTDHFADTWWITCQCIVLVYILPGWYLGSPCLTVSLAIFGFAATFCNYLVTGCLVEEYYLSVSRYVLIGLSLLQLALGGSVWREHAWLNITAFICLLVLYVAYVFGVLRQLVCSLKCNVFGSLVCYLPAVSVMSMETAVYYSMYNYFCTHPVDNLLLGTLHTLALVGVLLHAHHGQLMGMPTIYPLVPEVLATVLLLDPLIIWSHYVQGETGTRPVLVILLCGNALYIVSVIVTFLLFVKEIKTLPAPTRRRDSIALVWMRAEDVDVERSARTENDSDSDSSIASVVETRIFFDSLHKEQQQQQQQQQHEVSAHSCEEGK